MSFFAFSCVFSSVVIALEIDTACIVKNILDLNEIDPCYLKTKYYCCASVTNKYPQNNYMTKDWNSVCVPVIYHNTIFVSEFENDFYVKTKIECLLDQPVRDFTRDKACKY